MPETKKEEMVESSDAGGASPKEKRVKIEDGNSNAVKKEEPVENDGSDENTKLDKIERITESMHLVEGTLDENQAAVYFICDARVLKKRVQVISTLCKNSFMRVHKDALYISAIDQARACVCECKLGKEAFVKFNSKLDKFLVGIELPTLQKILSQFKDTDMIVFCIENENDDIAKVQGYHTFKHNNEFGYCKVRLVECKDGQGVGNGIPLDGNPVWNTIQMSSVEFTDLFKDYKELSGRNVCVTYTPDGRLILSIPTDVDGVAGETVLREETREGGLKMPKKPESEFRSVLNADYITKFGPLGSQVNPMVSLYMAENYPFACSYKDKNNSTISFYLIPRVAV